MSSAGKAGYRSVATSGGRSQVSGSKCRFHNHSSSRSFYDHLPPLLVLLSRFVPGRLGTQELPNRGQETPGVARIVPHPLLCSKAAAVRRDPSTPMNTTTAAAGNGPQRPLQALEGSNRYNVPPSEGNALLRLYRKARTALLNWKLRREGRELMSSFLRVAGEMGFHPNAQLHPITQLEKLSRVNAIAAELRELKYGHLKNSSTWNGI